MNLISPLLFPVYLSSVFFASLTLSSGSEAELAFPGAEGFGKYAQGGRGGPVIEVTTLADKGPGSLRAALDTPGPRTVVFKVGGTIELSNSLKVREPFLTVDGGSAPTPGITLKNGGLFFIGCHDIILRHLRFRPGAALNKQIDGLTFSRCQRVMVDHCSLSWSTDEVLDLGDWGDEGGPTTDITVQWCFITEALNKSTHDKGEHGYAALISNFEDGRVTLHHNLFAHHVTRMPRPGGQPGKPGLLLDFRNNVIYDWAAVAGYGDGPVRLNYVGNYLKPGPSTAEKFQLRVLQPIDPDFQVFLKDNIHATSAEGTADNLRLLKLNGRETDPSPYVTSAPFPVEAPVSQEDAETAARRVLTEAGATLPGRDAVDLRIVEQYEKGTGQIIDTPEQVGGWPDLTGGN